MLAALLQAQADPNAAAKGIPLLFAAATMGHTQAMKELLDHGADPNVRSMGEGWAKRKRGGGRCAARSASGIF